MRPTDVSGAAWRKSSRSIHGDGGQTDCVEVAELRDRVAMRDSKDPAGPVLAFPRTQWRAFLGHVRASDVD
ncbi:MAG: DUF397 domain-containing protein [Pseudonocardiaceae bacterium]